MANWTDNVRIDLADPLLAMESIREAHAWVTREMEVLPNGIRRYSLDIERKRLAKLAWIVKNPRPHWRY